MELGQPWAHSQTSNLAIRMALAKKERMADLGKKIRDDP